MKKKVNALLSRISFLQKMILLFVCGILIPLTAISIYYTSGLEKNIRNEIMQKLENSMDEKKKRIEEEVSSVLYMARSTRRDYQLYSLLDRDYPTKLDYLIAYQEELKPYMEERQQLNPQILQAVLFTDNSTIFNGYYVRTVDKWDDNSGLPSDARYIFRSELTHENGISFAAIDTQMTNAQLSSGKSIGFLCNLDYFEQYSRSSKLMWVGLNMSYFVQILSESDLFDSMFLVDDNSMLLLSDDESEINSQIIAYEGDKFKEIAVMSRKIAGLPVTLYGVYDFHSIASKFDRGFFQFIIFIMVMLITSAAVTFLIIWNIRSRLEAVVDQSREIAKGNFVYPEIEDSGTDEISNLERHINRMSEKLQELIEFEYKAELTRSSLEKETAQAQLLALQSQVNPHFLFNALESIRLKAMARGERETGQILKYLSKMFRNLLTWDENMITVDEEILFLDEFLHIQEYRFEDEFSYQVQVEADTGKYLLPKMILQPLVENACVHGVEAIPGNREVWIKVGIDNGKLDIHVGDNGGGMSAEKLQALLKDIRQKKGNGSSVGLHNVYRRLLLSYGDEFEFEISSELKKGTVCHIRIPAQTADTGN